MSAAVNPPVTGTVNRLFIAADIDAFNGADTHTQRWQAKMYGIEVNRRWWTWDVLSTMVGVRYIDYQEDYLFTSNHAANNLGLYSIGLDNKLIGAQVGADFLYPVNLRTSVAFKGKGGVYGNFSDNETRLINDGTNVLFSGDTKVDLAGLIELGMYGVYHVVPSIRLTAGYELWYMPGMATIPEQSPHVITVASGSSIANEDDVLLHGLTAGVQILF